MTESIQCNNCLIQIDEQCVAHIIWNNGVKQSYTNRSSHSSNHNVFIIPSPSEGFYYLHEGEITHVINDKTKKTVVSDVKLERNWFGSFDENDMLYFPKYNVLIITHFGGDHDYVWWWNLSVYDQYANIETPCYYNGKFNATIYLDRGNDRYAIGTYYGYTDDDIDENDEGEDQDEDEDEDKGPDDYTDTATILFDTKTMKYKEYYAEEIKNNETISTNDAQKRFLKSFQKKSGETGWKKNVADGFN
jgi:hypothetical protein